MQWLQALPAHLATLARHRKDTELDMELRVRCCAVCLVVVGAGLLLFALDALWGYSWSLWPTGMCIAVASAGATLAGQFLGLRARPATAVVLVGCFCGTLMMDLRDASQFLTRSVFLVVLLSDAVLLSGAPPAVQSVALALPLTYLAVERTEAAQRFGAYEVAWLGQGLPLPEGCACADPPCATGEAALTGWVLIAFIIITDNWATRNVVRRLRSQAETVDAAVGLAQRVATLLAEYRIEEAEVVVEGNDNSLPPQLRAAFGQLLTNLEIYRPFLPDTLLPFPSDSDQRTATHPEQALVEAPGLRTDGAEAEVCICFTDIQSSTALWESDSQCMFEALKVHNHVIRHVATECDGYEVKVIGDAFMLAFARVFDACCFGLEAQRELVQQQWPEALASDRLCACVTNSQGYIIWNGLRVRVALHLGKAKAERNPVTGRCDYFGPAVNTAARVEGVLRYGGLLGVTEAVLQSLGTDGLSQLGDPLVIPLGAKQLRGCAETVSVTVLLPPELAERGEVLPGFDKRSLMSSACSSSTGSSRPTSSHSGTHSKGRGGSVFSIGATSAVSGERETQRAPRARGARFSRLGLELRRSAGSCATVRVNLAKAEPVVMRLPNILSTIELSADQTSGQIISVMSACVLVTWNTSRACPDYVTECRQFFLCAQRDPRIQQAAHFGLTAGGMLHGNIAAGRKRFPTVIGGCVELSAALAEEAELAGKRGLAVGRPALDCASIGCAQQMQVWRGDGDIVVWSVGFPTGDRPNSVQSKKQRRTTDAAQPGSPRNLPAVRRTTASKVHLPYSSSPVSRHPAPAAHEDEAGGPQQEADEAEEDHDVFDTSMWSSLISDIGMPVAHSVNVAPRRVQACSPSRGTRIDTASTQPAAGSTLPAAPSLPEWAAMSISAAGMGASHAAGASHVTGGLSELTYSRRTCAVWDPLESLSDERRTLLSGSCGTSSTHRTAAWEASDMAASRSGGTTSPGRLRAGSITPLVPFVPAAAVDDDRTAAGATNLNLVTLSSVTGEDP
eukprot:TRINITY_DN17257_c0_g4_i2.p1 TRINITY_DN17257_c0_g4~~TRINITY_DN17257_c0_g4_i2.p1  ORF type:complete len:1048 (+),score=215.57 TRINITY_DN17257_c0_g4_i2:91-3144(+)